MNLPENPGMKKRINKSRIIIDTNLWISFLITKNFSFVDRFIETRQIILLFSEELIHEFLTVASRPKFSKYFTEDDIKELLKIIEGFSLLIHISTEVDHCRDEKDNFLLNLAVDGKADYLVTGDKDLLDLKKLERTKIITIEELKEHLRHLS